MLLKINEEIAQILSGHGSLEFGGNYRRKAKLSSHQMVKVVSNLRKIEKVFWQAMVICTEDWREGIVPAHILRSK